MSVTAKLAPTLVALAVGAVALAGCATVPEPAAGEPTPADVDGAEATPTLGPALDDVSQMPDWASEMHWLIYPDGFVCGGTEGCPNDYVLNFGPPPAVLPDNVEYYSPAKHDCTFVQPAGATCGR